MTAEMHKEKYPRACQFILESSYVDDLIDSVKNMQCAEKLAKDTEEVLAKGGFFVKCWQSTGASDTLQGGELKESADGCVGVLGVSWNPADDTINFVVTLNFSKKKHGERTEPKLERESLPESLPSVLTKRLVLQQVMGIYDPMGLVSPFTLLAKIYLRETWQLKLDWDDALPPQLYKKWAHFFPKFVPTGGPQVPKVHETPECCRGSLAHHLVRWERSGIRLCRLCALDLFRWDSSHATYFVQIQDCPCG